MSQTFKVRTARMRDARVIRSLIRLYPGHLVQNYIPSIRSFFVAEVEKQIVACCALEIYSKKIAEIRSLSVHSDFQGQGIASALVSACLDRAQKRRIKEVLAITGAVRLFEKAGFSTLQHEKYAMLKMLR